MKKILLTMTMFLAIAISLFVIACSNDVEKSQEKPQKQFDKDLAEYVAKQKGFMRSVVISRSGSEVTYEDMLEIAAKLDSCSMKFFEEHPEVYEALNLNVTEDEIIAMSLDTEELMQFVQANYSSEVYDAVYKAISDSTELLQTNNNDVASSNNDIVSSVSQITNKENDEMIENANNAILANIEVATEFEKTLTEVLKEDANMTVAEKNNYCYGKYVRNVNNCYSSLTRDVVIAALFGVGSGWSYIGASVGILVATQNYNECLRFAKEVYHDCRL